MRKDIRGTSNMGQLPGFSGSVTAPDDTLWQRQVGKVGNRHLGMQTEGGEQGLGCQCYDRAPSGRQLPLSRREESVLFHFAPKFLVVLMMRDAVPRHGSQ